MKRRTAWSWTPTWANHSGAPSKWPALAFFSNCRRGWTRADMPQARLDRQLMGQVIDFTHIATGNAFAQPRHDLVGLPEVEIQQLAHEIGVTIASGLELVQIHQRCAGLRV